MVFFLHPIVAELFGGVPEFLAAASCNEVASYDCEVDPTPGEGSGVNSVHDKQEHFYDEQEEDPPEAGEVDHCGVRGSECDISRAVHN